MSCNYSQDTNPKVDSPLSIVLNLVNQYDTTYHKQDFYFGLENNGYYIPTDSLQQHIFNVSITIKNNSNKSIFLWLMSCSWTNNFLVNNDYMFLGIKECDKNNIQKIEIKAEESRTYTTQLTKSIKFDYPCLGCAYGKQVETTKLGLIVINDLFNDQYIDYINLMKDKSKWTIYWSNPLHLLTPKESNPEPITIPVYKHN
jgi:hypothetical protein